MMHDTATDHSTPRRHGACVWAHTIDASFERHENRGNVVPSPIRRAAARASSTDSTMSDVAAGSGR
jgi:hypothetical protein